MSNRMYRTASDIYRAITSRPELKGYTVIIVGKTGPTGKSTLCKLLVNSGIKAIDISESLNGYVKYSDSYENTVNIDHYDESILVVLNRTRILLDEE